MSLIQKLANRFIKICKYTQNTSAPVLLIDYLKFKFGFYPNHIHWPINKFSTVSFPENITIGKGTAPGLSPFCYIQALNGIEIGDYTMIGPGVKIISSNHDLKDFSNHKKSNKIIIGKNCWLGANSILLPGVEIKDNTIVAAGAVVTKSFTDSNILIAGCPAKTIKSISEVNSKKKVLKYEYRGFYKAH